MKIAVAIKWLNRHIVSSVLILLTFGASALIHILAHTRMDIANRQFAIMNARANRQMALIDFMHTNYWIAISYLSVFLSCILWMEIRNAPRWTLWLTFCVLALPCLFYAIACVSISGKFM